MKQITKRVSRRASALALGLALAAVLSAGLGGCVGQQAYDDLVHENRALKSRNVELQARIGDLESMESGLRRQVESAPDAMAALEEAHNLTLQQLNQARQTIAELENRLDNMEFAQIDPVTDDALRRLAGQYPDLIRYDPDRGMLRFSSDLTFDSGSDAVKKQAVASLQALATILKSPEASGYDVRIVGHTDSQPLSARTRKRYPSNMHLSTYRAISVRNELVKLGVPAARMMAAGWGEYRPAVPNAKNGNTPANRRVEIYLVPGHGGASAASAPAGQDAVIDRDSLGESAYEPTK